MAERPNVRAALGELSVIGGAAETATAPPPAAQRQRRRTSDSPPPPAPVEPPPAAAAAERRTKPQKEEPLFATTVVLRNSEADFFTDLTRDASRRNRPHGTGKITNAFVMRACLRAVSELGVLNPQLLEAISMSDDEDELVDRIKTALSEKLEAAATRTAAAS